MLAAILERTGRPRGPDRAIGPADRRREGSERRRGGRVPRAASRDALGGDRSGGGSQRLLCWTRLGTEEPGASRPAPSGLLDDSEDAAERADVLEHRLATEVGPAAEEMALALHAARRRGGRYGRRRARARTWASRRVSGELSATPAARGRVPGAIGLAANSPSFIFSTPAPGSTLASSSRGSGVEPRPFGGIRLRDLRTARVGAAPRARRRAGRSIAPARARGGAGRGGRSGVRGREVSAASTASQPTTWRARPCSRPAEPFAPRPAMRRARSRTSKRRFEIDREKYAVDLVRALGVARSAAEGDNPKRLARCGS